MTATILDTIVPAETPEGILLELRPAGLCARCFAFALDWAIRIGLLWVASIITAIMHSGLGLAFWLILLFLFEWFYPVAFELGLSGATPGKRALGLKVVMDDGLPITPAASLTRNLLRVADFMPFAYGLGIVSVLVRRDCKRLGDLAAATLVVHQARPRQSLQLPEVAPIAPARPLSQTDRAALIAFATRAPRLTTERLDELAALAAVIVDEPGRAGPEVTRRVLGVAQYLLGRRPA